LLGLLGLVAGENAGEAIPLALAGAGTRQLTMFRLAAGLMGVSPIVVMDEPELGLEPYRQRKLVAEIREAVGQRGQAFLTTHSPSILGALDAGALSRLALGENPVRMAGDHIARIQRQAPDAFVSRLPVLCEGATEAGFLSPVLDTRAAQDGLGNIDVLGIRLLPRNGQRQVLDEATELLGVGISIGLFVDNENNFSGLRSTLAEADHCAYGCWTEVRNIEEAVATWTPWEELPKVLELGAKLRHRSVEDLLQQVSEAIGSPGRASLDELRDAYSEEEVRRALGEATQSENGWFKTEDRARSLGQLLLDIGIPEEMDAVLRPFWARLKEVAGWAPEM
jgi:putative ATP-dependent endonuclease of OLD family